MVCRELVRQANVLRELLNPTPIFIEPISHDALSAELSILPVIISERVARWLLGCLGGVCEKVVGKGRLRGRGAARGLTVLRDLPLLITPDQRLRRIPGPSWSVFEVGGAQYGPLRALPAWANGSAPSSSRGVCAHFVQGCMWVC